MALELYLDSRAAIGFLRKLGCSNRQVLAFEPWLDPHRHFNVSFFLVCLVVLIDSRHVR